MYFKETDSVRALVFSSFGVSTVDVESGTRTPVPVEGFNASILDWVIVKVTATIVSPVRSTAQEVFFGMVAGAESVTKAVPLLLGKGLKAGDVRAESDADYSVWRWRVRRASPARSSR